MKMDNREGTDFRERKSEAFNKEGTNAQEGKAPLLTRRVLARSGAMICSGFQKLPLVVVVSNSVLTNVSRTAAGVNVGFSLPGQSRQDAVEPMQNVVKKLPELIGYWLPAG